MKIGLSIRSEPGIVGDVQKGIRSQKCTLDRMTGKETLVTDRGRNLKGFTREIPEGLQFRSRTTTKESHGGEPTLHGGKLLGKRKGFAEHEQNRFVIDVLFPGRCVIGEKRIVFLKTVIRVVSSECKASRETFQKGAEPVFQAMVEVGSGLLENGRIRRLRPHNHIRLDFGAEGLVAQGQVFPHDSIGGIHCAPLRCNFKIISDVCLNHRKIQ